MLMLTRIAGMKELWSSPHVGTWKELSTSLMTMNLTVEGSNWLRIEAAAVAVEVARDLIPVRDPDHVLDPDPVLALNLAPDPSLGPSLAPGPSLDPGPSPAIKKRRSEPNHVLEASLDLDPLTRKEMIKEIVQDHQAVRRGEVGPEVGLEASLHKKREKMGTPTLPLDPGRGLQRNRLRMKMKLKMEKINCFNNTLKT